LPKLTEMAREKLTEGLPENQKEQASKLEFLGGFLPIERVLSGLMKIGKNASFLKNAEKIAAKEGISAAEAGAKIAREAEIAGIDLAKVAEGDKQAAGKLFNKSNELAGRVGNPKETATNLRVERTKPKEKIFPTEERVKVREEQLKSFPKYEAEITQDAAERAARAEAKIPKTVKGMDAKRLRVHAAEKNLPHAEESYRKSIARTRALEEEVVKHAGSEKERYKGLLEASKNDLKDAEFHLKQTMQNIAGGEARVGLEEMRKAAQEKMMKIGDQIAAGEEIKLAKMDYNPQMVQEAKRIGKKKPLPAVKNDDFYQQVHKEYGDQYRNQLSRIEKEIKDLPKTMSSAVQIRNLQKEKEILKKLIEQTEAERTIHRHKLGLRETAERHKAQERFKELEPKEGKPKVGKVAQEKMWRQRIEEIKSPQGRAKVSEDLIEEAAQANPKQAEKIRSEKRGLNEALDDLAKKQEQIKEKVSSTPKSSKEAKEVATETIENWHKSFQDLLRKVPVLGKTQLGRDAMIGIISGLVDEVKKEYDIPFTTSSMIAATLGRATGAPIRIMANQLTKWRLKKYHVEKAAEAYRQHNEKKFKSYSPSIRKEAKEQASSRR